MVSQRDAGTVADGTPFTNPILPGFYPDPTILRHDGLFYLVSSTFEYYPGLPVHASADLVHWDLVGHVIDRPGQLDFTDVRASGGLYAPTLRFHDGLFYVACTMVDAPHGSGNFYVTASDIAGPWSDPVWLPDAPGMDPTLLFDEGRAWWGGCRPAPEPDYEGHTQVWLQELDLARGALTGPVHVIWEGAVKGAVWAEGPHVYRRGDWYYVVAAEGGTARDHAVAVGRSRQLTGPYEVHAKNPVLTHRNLGAAYPVQNVGHADLVEAPDGSWWAVLLAVRTRAGRHVLGRETFLVPVAWEEDWPVLSPGSARVPERGVVPAFGTAGGGKSATADEDRWAQLRRIASDAGEQSRTAWLTLRGGADFLRPAELAGVRVVANGERVDELAHPSLVGLRLQGQDAELSVVVGGVSVPDAGTLRAGLVLRQSDTYQLRLELVVTAGAVRVEAVRVVDGRSSVLGGAALPVEASGGLLAGAGESQVRLVARLVGDEVQLRAVADDVVLLDVTTSNDVLSTEVAGGFVGTIGGVHATGTAGGAVVLTHVGLRH